MISCVIHPLLIFKKKIIGKFKIIEESETIYVLNKKLLFPDLVFYKN